MSKMINWSREERTEFFRTHKMVSDYERKKACENSGIGIGSDKYGNATLSTKNGIFVTVGNTTYKKMC